MNQPPPFGSPRPQPRHQWSALPPQSPPPELRRPTGWSTPPQGSVPNGSAPSWPAGHRPGGQITGRGPALPPPGTPGRFPVPQGPTEIAPMLPAADYQQPAWARAWHEPQPPRSRSGLIAGAMALLVAAVVATTVLLTQGARTEGTASPRSQQPPTPISEIAVTTTEPVTTDPVTTDPVTTEPATTEPVTTEPATTEPVTTEPVGPVTTGRQESHSSGDDQADQQMARAAAQTWAAAVNNADADGVLAHSCHQDRSAYANGTLNNPAFAFAGNVRFEVDTVITARPMGMVGFTVTPALDGKNSVKSLMTVQDGQWLVCVSVSDPDEL